MEAVIKVQNVSKQYQIGGLDAGYRTFRETFAGALTRPIRRLRGRGRQARENIWALKDVDFEITEGEIVGLIGHNGAGKSTLLKILSRITPPTTGRTEVHGHIGSLLEVGTGFHPDLTGRENIYLNGTILGLKRAHIKRRFDEIVSFSEIEKFIDTPVKWYSSGMYLRLAFSVAVHLDSDILIMDEVLAVGDVNFQQKCLDQMHEIRNQGRTILFVSHSMAAVTRLCERVVLLDQGRLIADGPANEVVKDYLGQSWQVGAERHWLEPHERPGNDVVRLSMVRMRTRNGVTVESIDIREPVGIELTYDVVRAEQVLTPKVDLLSEEGVHIFSSHDVAQPWSRQSRLEGRYVSTMWIPGNLLAGGNYRANVSVMSHHPATFTHFEVPNAVAFQVLDTLSGQSARGDYVGPIGGVVRPLLIWDTEVRDHANEEVFQQEVITVS
jgi:lipopolysaccharide transport system ATP-binding protein